MRARGRGVTLVVAVTFLAVGLVGVVGLGEAGRVRVVPFAVGDTVALATDDRMFMGGERIEVVRNEGPAIAVDRYGFERAVDRFREDELREGKRVRADVCDALVGSPQTVRRETLDAEAEPGAVFAPRAPLGAEVAIDFETRPYLSFGSGACMARVFGPAATYARGDRVRLSDLSPGAANVLESEAWSAAAGRTSYADRPALLFRFVLAGSPVLRDDGGELLLDLVVADGLPGPVRIDLWAGTPGEPAMSFRSRMTGYAPGSGAAHAPVGSGGLPPRHPEHAFAVAPRLSLDDSAYGFPFRFQEAFTAALAEPRTGLGDFLERAPEAHLREAHYDRYLRDPAAPSAETEGVWVFALCGPDECRAVEVSKLVVHGVVPQRVLVAHPRDVHPEPRFVAPGAEPEVAGSGALLGVFRAIEPDAGPILAMMYVMADHGAGGVAAVVLGDVSTHDPTAGERRGFVAVIDATTAGVAWIDARSFRASGGIALLAQGEGPGLAAPARPLLESLEAPAGLAAPLLAGLGILGVLLWLMKWVFAPFFSRIEPSRLLDHPSRRLLVERITAEPGVHHRALLRSFGGGNARLEHHLGKLLRGGLVRRERMGAATCYFPAGPVSAAWLNEAPFVRHRTARAIMERVRADPGVTMSRLAGDLGVRLGTLHYHVDRLEAAGLLRRRPVGSARALYLSEGA